MTLTLFWQGLFRVPHLHAGEHNRFSPLQGQPLPFAVCFLEQVLLHLQDVRVLNLKGNTITLERRGQKYSFKTVSQIILPKAKAARSPPSLDTKFRLFHQNVNSLEAPFTFIDAQKKHRGMTKTFYIEKLIHVQLRHSQASC